MEKRLAMFFAEELRPKAFLSDTWVLKATGDMNRLLKLRTPDEIKDAILKFKDDNPGKKVYHVWEVFEDIRNVATPKDTSKNLIKAGVFYYHPQLRNTPPLPRVINKEDGTEEWHIEPFYIEIKDTYSINDLHKYFTDKMNTESNNLKRDIGALKYLVDTYGLDEVLFTIEYVWDHCTCDDLRLPRQPFELDRWIHDGTERLKTIKAEATANGTDREIPRPV